MDRAGFSVPIPDNMMDILKKQPWSSLQIKHIHEKNEDESRDFLSLRRSRTTKQVTTRKINAILILLTCYDQYEETTTEDTEKSKSSKAKGPPKNALPHYAAIKLNEHASEVYSYTYNSAENLQEQLELKSQDDLNTIRLNRIYSKFVIEDDGKILMFFVNPQITKHSLNAHEIKSENQYPDFN